MSTANNKLYIMTNEPVNKLVCKMAVPSIISMLVSAVYNFADTFFIGKISTQAVSAVGIVFSYMAITQAIGFFFGHGSGNYISRELGAKRIKNAEIMAANGFFYSLLFSLVLVILGFVFMNPFLKLIGATKTIMPDAISYFTYILLGTPFIIGTFVLNNQLRLQGNAKHSLYGILSGAVLNVILDPILIFVCKLGVSGAAIATCISQITSFTILLIVSSKTGIAIRLKNFKPSVESFKEIVAGGLPSLCRQGLSSISTVALNSTAGAFGDSVIGAFSVVARITFIASSALLGFGQGFQTVCGFNYGAKKYNRVKQAYWFSIKTALLALTFISAVLMIFAKPIVSSFRADDALLIEIAVTALRLQALTLPAMSFIIITNMYLQNTKNTAFATILAISRQGVLFIFVLMILSNTLGILGIQLSQPIADVLTFIISIPLSIISFKALNKQ